MITIDKQLNLVIPLTRNDGTRVYVHSAPIRYETFEQYWLVLGKTFAQFTHHGFDARSAPSIAAICLKDVAQQTPRAAGVNWWEGNDGVGGPAGLLAEMTRLSSILAPQPVTGWEAIPLQVAIDTKLINEKEKSRVMNLLAFFTVASLVAPETDQEILVNGMAYIYSLQTTFLNVTEYSASLKTLTAEETTGENPQT